MCVLGEGEDFLCPRAPSLRGFLYISDTVDLYIYFHYFPTEGSQGSRSKSICALDFEVDRDDKVTGSDLHGGPL